MRFGLPLEALTDGRMTWAEGNLLVRQLLLDPTSHLYAAVAGWDHPYSHEARALADTYDLVMAANTGKQGRGKTKPYPRPWRVKTHGTRSAPPVHDQAAIRAALAARGH